MTRTLATAVADQWLAGLVPYGSADQSLLASQSPRAPELVVRPA